jgi:hypothetical protein
LSPELGFDSGLPWLKNYKELKRITKNYKFYQRRTTHMALYTEISEISRLTGLSVTTLRRGARSGRFPHVREGDIPRGKLLFNLQEITQVLATEAQNSMHKDMATQDITILHRQNHSQ